MPRTVDIEAARRSFLTAGRYVAMPDIVRPEVLASWERSQRLDVDPERITARFLGHHQDSPTVLACAEEVFDDFLAVNGGSSCSLVLLDPSGVVRVRRDGDHALARLLDGVLLVPGYGYAERAVGTTAASIAQHEKAGIAITAAEHYHSQLMFLDEAAAPVFEPEHHELCAVAVVICHHAAATTLQLPLARMLADRIADRLAGEPHRRSWAILERFGRCCDRGGEWVLATDGDYVMTNGLARHLDAPDQRVLSDLVLGSLVLQDFTNKHIDLPSGAAPRSARRRCGSAAS